MRTRSIGRSNAFLMIVLIIFWGSSFVVVKLVLKEGLTPVAIATFRFLTAGAIFLIALLLRKTRNRKYLLLIEKKDSPMLLVLALTGVTFFFTAQYTGINMAGASIAAILVCLLSPVLINILSAAIFKEHLTKKQGLGIGIAAVGTFTVVTGSSVGFQGNQFFYGTLILLSTPFLWATYTLVGRKIMLKYDPFLIVAYTNVLGGLCLIPFSLAENSFNQIITMNLYEWAAILFLAFTCSFLGYYIWFYVINKVGAVASSFLFAEPLVTALFATAFVGEQIGPFTIAGGLLIFTGVYLVTRK